MCSPPEQPIPDWVNWIAQDANGNWWGYSTEPLQYHEGWYENEVGEHILLKKDTANPEWTSTLLKISDSLR